MNSERSLGLFPKSFDTEQAGRAVVRAATHRYAELSEVLDMPLAERTALDAALADIDEAQKVCLETGALRVIGVRS